MKKLLTVLLIIGCCSSLTAFSQTYELFTPEKGESYVGCDDVDYEIGFFGIENETINIIEASDNDIFAKQLVSSKMEREGSIIRMTAITADLTALLNGPVDRYILTLDLDKMALQQKSITTGKTYELKCSNKKYEENN